MGFKQIVTSPVLVIFVTIVLLFSLLAYMGVKRDSTEKFYDKYDPSLLPGDKIQVFQGSQMPDKLPTTPIQFDQKDPSAPSVDGTLAGPKSLYMMTYNAVSPECCNYSPYSTEGGCVCITKDQMKFVGSRGKNSGAGC